MTSLTMYSEWTAPTMLSSMWTAPTPKRAKIVRQMSTWARVIDTTATVLCPVVVSAAAIFAAAVWPAPAHADLTDSTTTDVLTNLAGIDAGPMRTSFAEFGESLCPMLVRPGSTFATNASQLQGNGGLTSAIAGAATGMAIQMECPAFMRSLADGSMPTLLQGIIGSDSVPALPFQLPGS